MKEISLKLEFVGSYKSTKKGIWFYTERGFKVFVSNRILRLAQKTQKDRCSK